MSFSKFLFFSVTFFSLNLQASKNDLKDEDFLSRQARQEGHVTQEKLEDISKENSENHEVVSAPCNYRKNLEEKYNKLTNHKSQKSARELYEQYRNPPKPKRRKKDRRQKTSINQSTRCLNDSARLGYVPAQLELARQELIALQEEDRNLSEKREEREEKLGGKKNSSSILEANNVFMEQFHLGFDQILDVQQRISLLESKKEEFNYDYLFLRENDMSFLMFSERSLSKVRQETEEPSLDELRRTLSKQINSVESFNLFHERLRLKIESLKPGSSTEERAFVEEVKTIFGKYDSSFTEHRDKILNDLSANVNILKKGGEYRDSFDYDVHKLEKKQKILSEDLFSTIKKYSDKKYVVSRGVFEGLKKLKEEVTSICCSFSWDFDPDQEDSFLASLAYLYIKSHEEVPLESQSIKERIILLREAQRYLGVLLENPKEYLRITNPAQYQLMKSEPDFSKKAATYRRQSSMGAHEPEFSTSLSDLNNRVQVRLLKYYLDPVNECYPSYSSALQRSSIHRDLEAFIQFSETTFSKFNSQTLDQNIQELDGSNLFYYYDGKVQRIWTYKKFPFFIRLNRNNNEYKVGFLREHPYTPTGFMKFVNSWPLVTNVENELFKFSFRHSRIIPSSHKDFLQWTEKGLSKKDALMKAAHPKI